GHAHDVAARDPSFDGSAERDVTGDIDAEIEHARHRDAFEVLDEMTGNIIVARERGEDVDETEQLRLEFRARHRPVEHPLAPPGHPEHLRALAGAQLGQLPCDRRHSALERAGHAFKVPPHAACTGDTPMTISWRGRARPASGSAV